MTKKITFLLIIITAVTFLSGCYDYQEPNDIAYIVAIGIDEGREKGTYNFTLQYARPSSISGGANEEGGSGEKTMDILSIDSPSVYSALNVANHIISKTFTLSHTKIIVISDSVAKKGIAPLIDTLARSSDIRPSVFMCVSKGSAEDYLKSVKPTIEINPVKYYRLIFENPNSTYLSRDNAKDFYFNLKTNTKQNAIPLVGVGKGAEKEDSEKSEEASENGEEDSSSERNTPQNNTAPINKSGFEYLMREYVAGELDVEKKNKSEAVGTAVFKGDKYIADLNSIESEIYNLLNGTYNQGYAVFYSKRSPNAPITVRLEQNKKPKHKIEIINDRPKIETTIYLEATFMSLPTEYTVKSDIEGFEIDAKNYIKESVTEFLNKTAKELNSDIVGYGNYSKRLFLTNSDFEGYDWNEKYKDSEFEVLVDFDLRRSGLIIRPDEKEVK